MPSPKFSATPDAIALFRSIAAASGDALLIADAAPHPDAKLLDLAADALHALIQGEALYDANRRLPLHEAWENPVWQQQLRDEGKELSRRARASIDTGRIKARAMGKLRASTGAGIYAKATVCNASVTGAAVLAKSLAADLIANPSLRASLWPTEAAR